ncbi:MAG: nuclear transport factor 2 family protein [Pseudomonadota bacterium]
MKLSRQQLIDLSVTYFEACNRHEWQAVMDTFSEDCLMWFPAATFTYRGKQALGTHFEEFLSTFDVIDFHDYTHVPDPVTQSICTYFSVSLVGHDGAKSVMKNCNIFKLNADGVFAEIIIYNSGKLDAGFHAGSE